jgi:hypothetical protein
VDAAGPEDSKWMVVLPPEGAARTVGESLWAAFGQALPPARRKLFDTRLYLDGFDRLLKDPSDDMVVDLLNQSLVVQCLDFRATHVLVLALSPITAFTAALLKRNGMVTLHWFYEDFRQAGYWRDVLPAYTHFLAIQRGPVEEACRGHGVRYRYLPTASTLPLDRHPRPWAEREGGMVFVGFPSEYRVAVLEAIVAAGLPLAVAGAGWDRYRGPLQACIRGTGWAGADESLALLENSRVGLHIPGEDPSADRENGHISPRVFDVLGAGALLLCEDAPLVRETLRGCVYREFRGPGEAVEAARRALADGLPPGAQASNRDTVLREHAFARRVADLLSVDS